MSSLEELISSLQKSEENMFLMYTGTCQYLHSTFHDHVVGIAILNFIPLIIKKHFFIFMIYYYEHVLIYHHRYHCHFSFYHHQIQFYNFLFFPTALQEKNLEAEELDFENKKLHEELASKESSLQHLEEGNSKLFQEIEDQING